MKIERIIPLLILTFGLIGCGRTGQSTRVKHEKTPYDGELFAKPHQGLSPAVKPKLAQGKLGDPSHPVPRARWADGTPNLTDINPMNGIRRITVHHDGMPGLFFSNDFNETASRIELIRHRHRNNNGWADIGYHFVIDRNGRVWEARSLKYQGAHVKDQNENNLGILVLGNFQIQKPKAAQIAALKNTIRHFRKKYKVPATNVYTHGELGQTTCPGAHLQQYVNAIRNEARFKTAARD
jgi:hypothetical protein